MSAAVRPDSIVRTQAPGAVTYGEKRQPVVCGSFSASDPIGEIFAAATALERIGYEPKLKFGRVGDDPAVIQLVVDDVGDIMTKLRASLVAPRDEPR
jgi:hypothetical protein